MLEVHGKGSRGSAITEMAISLPLFFLLVILGLEFIRVCYVSVSLQHAVNKGARYASLFRTETGMTRGESIRFAMRRSVPIQLQDSQISICPAPATACAPSAAHATPHQMIAVSARYDLQTVIGGFLFPLEATVVTRNEPFN